MMRQGGRPGLAVSSANRVFSVRWRTRRRRASHRISTLDQPPDSGRLHAALVASRMPERIVDELEAVKMRQSTAKALCISPSDSAASVCSRNTIRSGNRQRIMTSQSVRDVPANVFALSILERRDPALYRVA